MKMRESIRQSVTPHLRPAEVIQGVVVASTLRPILLLAAVLPGIGIASVQFRSLAFFVTALTVVVVAAMSPYRILVVTQQRILFFSCIGRNVTKAGLCLGEFDRRTPLPYPRFLFSKIILGDQQLWVARNFRRDLQQLPPADLRVGA
jgi:hypothetical protein